MSFLTEIENASSKKISLIKLYPKEIISVSAVSLNIYQATTNRRVSKCFVVGKECSLVANPSANFEYSFDYSTGLISIYSDTAITSVVIEHAIHLCSDKNRAIGSNPETPLVDVIEWKGRIKKEPSYSQSVENLSSGIITVNTSSIEIFNDGFMDFVFDNNSYIFNCRFDCWFVCEDISNINYAFSGLMVNASQNGFNLTIQTSDILQKLQSECYCGDSDKESFFTDHIYSSGDPAKYGLPVPFIFGPTSHSKINNKNLFHVSLDSDSLREAFCNSYSEIINGNNNRSWTCCRVVDATTYSGSVPFTYIGQTLTITLPNSSDGKKFIIGDRFTLGSSLDCVVSSVSGTTLTAFSPISPGASPQNLIMCEIPYIDIIDNNGLTREISNSSYSIVKTTLINGNKLLSILFNLGFESAYSGMSALDPRSFKVLYRAKPILTENQDAVEKIINGAGIQTDFTNTVAAYDSCLEIPAFGESSYQGCNSYLQKIMQSCGTFIYLDDGKLNYGQFNAPGSPDPVTFLDISDDDIIKGSLSISESSQDVCSKINYFPSCAKFEYPNGITYFLDDQRVLTSNQKEESVESVIYPLSISAQTQAQLTSKQSIYSFKLKTKGYGLRIGSAVRIANRYLTVVSISKSVSGIEISATNIYNL